MIDLAREETRQHRRAGLEHLGQLNGGAGGRQRIAKRHGRVDELAASLIGQDVAVYDLEAHGFTCPPMKTGQIARHQVRR